MKKSKSKKAKESGAENEPGDGGKKAAVAAGGDVEMDKSDDAELSKVRLVQRRRRRFRIDMGLLSGSSSPLGTLSRRGLNSIEIAYMTSWLDSRLR